MSRTATLPPKGGERVRVYTVEIQAGGLGDFSEEVAEELLELLAPYGAAVVSQPVSRAFSVLLSLRSANAVDAVREALSAVYASLVRTGYPVGKITVLKAELSEGTA